MFHISILGTIELPSDLNNVISVRKPPKTNERIGSIMILRGVGEGACLVLSSIIAIVVSPRKKLKF